MTHSRLDLVCARYLCVCELDCVCASVMSTYVCVCVMCMHVSLCVYEGVLVNGVVSEW